MFKTLTQTYFFFAKSDVERDLWLESFAKVVEVNKESALTTEQQQEIKFQSGIVIYKS